jgi:hypothetical protein
MKEFSTSYMLINSADIKRAGYQRNINANRAQQIANKWDETQANEPKLSYRDGSYWIFDGQHTLSARKIRNHGNDLDVRCKVYFGMTYEDEAQKFAHQQDLSKRIEMNAKVRSMYEGREIDVVNLVSITEAAGVKISFSGGEADNQINAVDTALSIYKKYGAVKYIELLGVSMAAWNGVYPCFNQCIMRGLAEFIAKYDSKYDRKTLIRKLSLVHPVKLLRDSKLRAASRNKICDEICEIYNKRMHNKISDVA